MIWLLLQKWFGRKSPSDDRGRAGERLAEQTLSENHGYRLVARNWRNPRDRREEIDLVMKDGAVLVFVEVKTRVEGSLVTGYHAVNERKRAVLRRAVAAYLRSMSHPPVTHRLDIVEVIWPRDGKSSQAEVLVFAGARLKRRQ